MSWQPIETAPKDGTEILIRTDRGAVQAWYSPGEWSDETPDHPREYSGSVWVCYDDVFQIEIEETPEGDFSAAKQWMPLPKPPVTP